MCLLPFPSCSLSTSHFSFLLSLHLSALFLGKQRSFLSKCMSQDPYLPGKHYASSCVVLFQKHTDRCAVCRYKMWIGKNIQLPSPRCCGLPAESCWDILLTVAVAVVQEGFGPHRALPPSFSHSPPPDQRAVNAHIISLWSSCQAGEQMLYC